MTESKDREDSFSREGAPWGSPAGAIKRWLQRRRNGKQNGTSPDSE